MSKVIFNCFYKKSLLLRLLFKNSVLFNFMFILSGNSVSPQFVSPEFFLLVSHYFNIFSICEVPSFILGHKMKICELDLFIVMYYNKRNYFKYSIIEKYCWIYLLQNTSKSMAISIKTCLAYLHVLSYLHKRVIFELREAELNFHLL